MESEEDTLIGCLVNVIGTVVLFGGLIIYQIYNPPVNKKQQITPPSDRGYYATEIVPKDSMKGYILPLKINKIEFKDVNQNGKLETLVITFDEQ